MSGNSPLPAMSVVLVTPTDIGNLRLPLTGLLKQTVRHQLQLVLVTPADESAADHANWLAGFNGITVVRVDRVRSRGAAAAAGVRAARGTIVALMENHVFPEQDWGEQMLRAHEGPWAAIGPRIKGLNLRTWTSRAYSLLFYGRLSARDEPQESDHLPWHNVAYKSSLLQPFVNQLEDMLDHEERFHQLLRAHGHRCYLWPAAQLRHAMVSRPERALALALCTGRLFAGDRARSWPWRRRLLYAAASPVFPWIRLAQMRRDLQRIARQEPTLLQLPLLLFLLHAVALGEVAGYLVGVGPAAAWLDQHELFWEARMTRVDVNELENLVLRHAAR